MATIWKLATVLVLASALTACGSSKPKGVKPPAGFQGGMMLKPAGLLFAGFDIDQNYAVTPDELADGLELAFQNADMDANGRLTLFEYQDWSAKALGSPTATPGWMELDRDGSTSIDPIEFRGGFERLAKTYGLTGPNGLLISELTGDMPVMSASRPSGGMPSRSRGGRRPPRIQTTSADDAASES